MQTGSLLWMTARSMVSERVEELLKSNEIYREVYESQTGGGGDFDEKRGEA